MTYKERMAAYCKSCEHHSTCGWVKIRNIEKCFNVQEFMSGWEAGQTDTQEEIKKYIKEATQEHEVGLVWISGLINLINELKKGE